MAIYKLQMQTFSRSNGSSAPGLGAYRSGERIRDERSGRTYDHTDRQDVMYKEIVVPARLAGVDMSWAANRSTLWNAAEIAEKQRNARVAREYMIALPPELTHRQRVDAVRGFAQELADRYGFAVDAVVHAPRDFPGSDPRNFHAHLLTTTREVTPEGLGRKTTFDLNDDNRRKLGLGRGVEELFFARRRWAEVANSALASAHIDARIDHRSLEAQGVTRERRLWIPRVAYEIERRGGHSFVAERIRENHRARLEPQRARSEPQRSQPEPQRAAPESRIMERVHNRALSQEAAALQAIENWRRYRLEHPRPTPEESIEKYKQYLHDKETLGEARAAEIRLQRTPAAGQDRDRDYDFGL